jgi:hypothetical protein
MGANLEGAGQVRNIFPHLISTYVQETFNAVAVTTYTGTIEYNRELPFDSGPDRSARVFLVLSQIGYITIPSALQAAIEQYSALLFWQSPDGEKFHLGSFSSDLMGDTAETIACTLMLPVPFFTSKPGVLGKLLLEVQSLTGTAEVETIVTLNIGFYTDYEVQD